MVQGGGGGGVEKMIIIKASCYALLNVLAIMAVMFKGIK